MTTVAILGAGAVGRALGERLMEVGCTVQFGVRDPLQTKTELTGAAVNIPSLAPAAASANAEMIFLAVPAAAALSAAQSAGDLTGKIIVDCTNPIRWDAGPVWMPPPEGSMAQLLAAALPGVRIVKGFNHFGAEIHRNPQLQHGPTEAFFAGDDADAKRRVGEVASLMGFRAQDAGMLRNAALLENLAVLWIQLATVGGAARTFAFRMDLQV